MKHNIKTKVNSNFPRKLDTSKSFYILSLSKTILSLPKQNILKTFLFYHAKQRKYKKHNDMIT